MGYHQIRKVGLGGATENGFQPPLFCCDVEKVDHQDDCAASRTFLAATLEYIHIMQPDELGNQTFLFIFGELIDACQNRRIGFDERIRMAF